MEWQQLLGFYTVARLGSFTRAAEATFRTQSALSQQVKALEEELGCPLFERLGRRRLRITPAGEKLREFAGSLLARYNNLKEEISGIQGLEQGRLSLAAPFTTLYHLLPRPLQTYLARFPHVELTLLDRPQSGVIALVKSGEVDFGLALESVIPKDLDCRCWQEVSTVLMVPRGHPLTRLPRVSLKEIAAYPLIVPPRTHRGRSAIEEQFRRLGLKPQVVMESTNVELSARYVELGLGLSFATLGKDLPEPAGRPLEFIPLGRDFPPDHLAVALRRDKVLSPLKKAFLGVLLGREIPRGAGADSP